MYVLIPETLMPILFVPGDVLGKSEKSLHTVVEAGSRSLVRRTHGRIYIYMMMVVVMSDDDDSNNNIIHMETRHSNTHGGTP